MDMLANAAVPSISITAASPRITTPRFNPLKARRPFHCVGKNNERNDSHRAPSQMELESHNNLQMRQSMKSELEEKHNDIWQLFREAQQNILSLNNKRLLAIEELTNLKRERKSLLDRIEQLEVKKQASSGADRLSVSSRLLLRIDSMVLTGMLGASEASDLRRLVINLKVSIADTFSHVIHEGDAQLLGKLRHFTETNKTNGFHVIHVCTEMDPVISVGSLASYVTGLSLALQRKGNLVEVILPKYAGLKLEEIQGLREIDAEFFSYFNGKWHINKIWTGVVCGIGVTFIQPIDYSSFFIHEEVYGYSNDVERFTYFSRASLDYIIKLGKQPDVLHVHNWETSIIGPLFWDHFVHQGLGTTRILLTCQGFDSRCIEQPHKLALSGLDPARLHRPDRLQDNNKPHLVNILKGGIVYSNKVIIMSSTQTKEQIIQSLGHGLKPTLDIHKDKVVIAPCGCDSSTWDPSVDKFLPQNYSADDLRGKTVCKVALQQRMGLPEHTSTVLVGCIFSEVSNLDLENLRTLVWVASKKGTQFVVMGPGKTPGINKAIEYFEEEFKDENMRFVSKYDEALSHSIFAGCDIILCPSFDDPLLQVLLKAIKYGAIPVAMNYGDYRFKHFIDRDFESSKLSQYISNTFANVSLSQAIEEIKNNPLQWNRKVVKAMMKDFSWDAECCDIHISAYTSIKNL